MDEPLAALQARLQHHFSDHRLLARALTHRSSSAEHNERLEFLGDSVLNLAVAALLYRRLQSMPEGDLSRVRANLVKQETLHRLAESIDDEPLRSSILNHRTVRTILACSGGLASSLVPA